MGMFVKSTSMLYANDQKHFVNGFDWGTLGIATVVDVGATSLFLSLALAKKHPRLSFEIQPQPSAIADVKSSFDVLDSNLKSRFTLSTQSMFAPQNLPAGITVAQSRIYLLKHVLHNLPDTVAGSVLGSISQIVKEDDKIIIMDYVLPSFGELSNYQEGMLRTRDMIQREMANGKTRSKLEWKDLIECTDASLQLRNINKPLGSDLWILEVQKVAQLE